MSIRSTRRYGVDGPAADVPNRRYESGADLRETVANTIPPP